MRRYPAPHMVMFALVLAAFSAIGWGSELKAHAEEAKPKTLLELLFKRQTPEAAPKEKSAKPAAKPRRKDTSKARRTADGGSRLLEKPAAAPPAEKLADAKVILVIGDFLAAGLAAGLTEAFAQTASVRIVNAANGDSGLVRDDFHDWDAEVGPLMEEHKPAAVVVFVGTNDRQTMQVAGQREAVLTPAWKTEYRSRAQALASAVTGAQLPLFWVGQLPQRAPAANASMLALNDIFRDVTGTGNPNLQYVDVWEGFVDEGGRFMERGPDINGQTVALRSGQVNVTRAGFRKVAFYVERAIGRIALPGAANVAAGTGGGFGNAILPPLVLGLPDVEANFARMRPVDLLAPDGNESGVLMGERVTPVAPSPISPASSPPAGRIDNFQMPALRR